MVVWVKTPVPSSPQTCKLTAVNRIDTINFSRITATGIRVHSLELAYFGYKKHQKKNSYYKPMKLVAKP